MRQVENTQTVCTGASWIAGSMRPQYIPYPWLRNVRTRHPHRVGAPVKVLMATVSKTVQSYHSAMNSSTPITEDVLNNSSVNNFSLLCDLSPHGMEPRTAGDGCGLTSSEDLLKGLRRQGCKQEFIPKGQSITVCSTFPLHDMHTRARLEIS
jgi:hypothetical protein